MPYHFTKNASFEIEAGMRRGLQKIATYADYGKAVSALEEKAKTNGFAKNLHDALMTNDFTNKKFDADIIAQLIGADHTRALLENFAAVPAIIGTITNHEKYLAKKPEDPNSKINRILSILQKNPLAELVFAGMYGKAPEGQVFNFATLLNLLDGNTEDAKLVAKTLENNKYSVIMHPAATTNKNNELVFKQPDVIHGYPLAQNPEDKETSMGISDYNGGVID